MECLHAYCNVILVFKLSFFVQKHPTKAVLSISRPITMLQLNRQFAAAMF